MGLEQLIEQCKKNNRAGQEQLYRLFGSKLYSICLKYARNKVEAEDCLQDAFVTIFEKINQFDNKGSFEGWAKRVTINTVLQKYRKEGVFNLLVDDVEDEHEVYVEDEEIPLEYLLAIIQELPDRYRLTFNLYAIDGYSHKEIAQMLEIAEGSSKSNLARARSILKKRIEDDYFKKKANSL